jgi:hypothetical protein
VLASEIGTVSGIVPHAGRPRLFVRLQEYVRAAVFGECDAESMADILVDEDVGARLAEEAFAKLPPEGSNPKADEIRNAIRKRHRSGRPKSESWGRRISEEVERLMGAGTDRR